MVKPEILNSKPITIAELKEELGKITKRDKELGYRASKTMQYLESFPGLNNKKAEELRAKLEGLKISRLKEEYVVKIVDTMPNTVDELKALLQAYVVTISNEDLKKIVEAVNEFTAEKK